MRQEFTFSDRHLDDEYAATDNFATLILKPVSKLTIGMNSLRVEKTCHSGTQTAGINSSRNPVKTLIYWMPGQARHDGDGGCRDQPGMANTVDTGQAWQDGQVVIPAHACLFYTSMTET